MKCSHIITPLKRISGSFFFNLLCQAITNLLGSFSAETAHLLDNIPSILIRSRRKTGGPRFNNKVIFNLSSHAHKRIQEKSEAYQAMSFKFMHREMASCYNFSSLRRGLQNIWWALASRRDIIQSHKIRILIIPTACRPLSNDSACHKLWEVYPPILQLKSRTSLETISRVGENVRAKALILTNNNLQLTGGIVARRTKLEFALFLGLSPNTVGSSV